MTHGILRFLRTNTIALVALFLALGGTASAATLLPAGSVGTKQLKKNAVTAAKIKGSAVTSAKIKAGAVTSAKIAAGAVTGEKIGSGAVTAEKLAAGAVTTASVADDSITGAKVLESSLGKVPAAANADTVGGVGPGVFGSTQIYLGTTFRPRSSTQTYTYGFNGAISTTVNTDRFMVPVWLPQGATVTSMTMYYNNLSSGSAGITWLTSYPGNGGLSTDLLIADAPTATGQGSVSALMPTTPVVIDNTSKAYVLLWNGATSLDWRLCSVKLTYTLPGAHSAASGAGPSSGGTTEQQSEMPPSEIPPSE